MALPLHEGRVVMHGGMSSLVIDSLLDGRCRTYMGFSKGAVQYCSGDTRNDPCRVCIIRWYNISMICIEHGNHTGAQKGR